MSGDGDARLTCALLLPGGDNSNPYMENSTYATPMGSSSSAVPQYVALLPEDAELMHGDKARRSEIANREAEAVDVDERAASRDESAVASTGGSV
jgi:hypothetical protein